MTSRETQKLWLELRLRTVFTFLDRWMKVFDSEFQIFLHDSNNKSCGHNTKMTHKLWPSNYAKLTKIIFLKRQDILSVLLLNKGKDNWFKRFSLRVLMKRIRSVLFATWEKMQIQSEISYWELNSIDCTFWTVMGIQSLKSEWLTVLRWSSCLTEVSKKLLW